VAVQDKSRRRASLKSVSDKAIPRVERTPWGTISREQVVATAIEEIAKGGYEQLTIRSLAARLGVAPMSLYRHIRDKDDLLDEVVERLLVGAWEPSSPTADWRAWVTEAADKLRALLVAEPAALYVYLRHPVVSPVAIQRMKAIMGVLRQAGLDEPAARRAYAALHTYTVGFAALEASRAGWTPPEGRVNSVARQLAAYTTPRQFTEGLRYLLEGIERNANGL
jgi:TetR/AcrR family transcriptional regulator, tetracycline repressor protein